MEARGVLCQSGKPSENENSSSKRERRPVTQTLPCPNSSSDLPCACERVLSIAAATKQETLRDEHVDCQEHRTDWSSEDKSSEK